MENKKNSKKQIVLIIITSVIFLSLVIGASFAYFAAEQNGAGTIPTTVSTKTIDTVVFSTSKMQNGVEVTGPAEIIIDATPDNFGISNDDLIGSAKAKVTLTTSNAPNYTVSKKFGLYLKILSNNFTYSSDSSTPDLIINEVVLNGDISPWDIPGLEEKHMIDNKGYQIYGWDITTLPAGTEIELDSTTLTLTTDASGGSKTETMEWKVGIKLVNYPHNQNNITNKSFTAKLELREI